MSILTLGCRAFLNEFLTEFEKDKKEWAEIYKSNKKWTAKMLGTKESRENGDYGLLGRIGKKFGYEIAAEWRRIDQVWFHYLPKPERWKERPWRNDVVVEHENDIANLEYTFNKFEEISAPFKVGIFYPGRKGESQSLKMAHDMILKQVSYYPGEVYLIIFGFLDKEKGVYWHAYEIDFKGNIIKLHT